MTLAFWLQFKIDLDCYYCNGCFFLWLHFSHLLKQIFNKQTNQSPYLWKKINLFCVQLKQRLKMKYEIIKSRMTLMFAIKINSKSITFFAALDPITLHFLFSMFFFFFLWCMIKTDESNCCVVYQRWIHLQYVCYVLHFHSCLQNDFMLSNEILSSEQKQL